MRKSTPFTPQQHGYKFQNYFDGPYPALCGGMAFGALDYYYKGLQVPQTQQARSGGVDPVYNYILRRQLDAHAFAIPRLVEGRSQWGTNSRATSVGRAYTLLKSWIDRLSPIPLLLGDLENPLSTNSHWVVGVGYEDTSEGRCARIYLYDSNYPSQDCWLAPSNVEGDRQWFNHSKGVRYGFYVPHPEYRPQDPRTHSGPGWNIAGGSITEL